MAKEEGQHPYHKSEHFLETLLILQLPYCVAWILPSCKRGYWNKYSTFAFVHCCPKQNWSSINKRESRIDIGKAVSYLPFVHLMMRSWNPSPPSWTIIRQFSPWLLLVFSKFTHCIHWYVWSNGAIGRILQLRHACCPKEWENLSHM